MSAFTNFVIERCKQVLSLEEGKSCKLTEIVRSLLVVVCQRGMLRTGKLFAGHARGEIFLPSVSKQTKDLM